MPISINGSSVGRVGKWLKRDGFAIVLFALTAIAMTFPLILHLNRLLIGDTTDVFPELWTTWWQHKAISEGLPLRYSNYLFYPGGFDATFSIDRWPELLMSWPLSSVIPITSTYNLIGLASLVFGAYTTYLLLNYVLGHRSAAWLGSAFFTFYPRHLVKVFEQPSVARLHWLPIVLLLLLTGLEALPQNGSDKGFPTVTFIGAGLLLGATAYINLKIYVFSGVVAVLVVVLMAVSCSYWRQKLFWLGMIVVAVGAIVIALPVVLPFLHLSWLDTALERAGGGSIDVLTYLLPAYLREGRTIFDFPSMAIAKVFDFRMPYVPGEDNHLSFTAIFLVVIGTVAAVRKDFRRMSPWMLTALLLGLLSLGPTLIFNSVSIQWVPMPYALVDDFVLFRVVRQPNRLALLMILPMSVLAGYGLKITLSWLQTLSARRIVQVIPSILLTVFMLYELRWSKPPLYNAIVPDYFLTSGDDDSGAYITLPLTRTPSKVHMYYQVFHNHPIIEGQAPRIEPGAFSYIEANGFLTALRQGEIDCDRDYTEDIHRLLEDGFTKIIFINMAEITSNIFELAEPPLPPFLMQLRPVYSDEILRVYDLSEIQRSWHTQVCRDP